MASNVTISVTIFWRAEDGDRETCLACGDACWLTQYRLWLNCGGEEFPADIEYVVCSACGECGGAA